MTEQDKQLARLLQETQADYIMDQGFTQRVLEALPPVRRPRQILRRRLIVLTSGLMACLLWAMLAYPALHHGMQTLKAVCETASEVPLQIAAYLSVSASVCLLCLTLASLRRLRLRLR